MKNKEINKMSGINSVIKYKGHSFHIQTQDQGQQSKYIESLIYKSGKILASRKIPYTSLLGSPNLKSEIDILMKEQHKAIIKEVTDGALDHKLGLRKKSAPPKISAPKIVPKRTDKIEVKLENFSYISPAVPLSLSIAGKRGHPQAPVPFLNITIQAVTEYGKEYPMFNGSTDDAGKLVLGLNLPQFSDQRFIITIKGEKEGLISDEIKLFLKKN